MNDCLYTVYTFGCDGKQIKDLTYEMDRLRAILVDIRSDPYGRCKVFNRPELQARFGARYIWIPELGSVNERNGKPPQFANIDVGARRLGGVTADGTPVVLLCSCEKYEHCHRLVLGEQLRDECGWGLQHLPFIHPESGNLFGHQKKGGTQDG